MFLAQLPAAPSSARVALWRRLRASGAASVQNGVWVLPKSEAHAVLLTQLADTVRDQGGSCSLFEIMGLTTDEHERNLARFRADRAREYDEFATRMAELLAEIAKETRKQKFTFAELEEIEDDFDKMVTWLDKIKARDFFPDHRLTEAAASLDDCRLHLKAFAEQVYIHEGVSPSPDGTAEQDGHLDE